MIKVTAFIRKGRRNVGKNDDMPTAHVYFRVRDGGVDLKASSELTISPNHWSSVRQGYKPRVTVVAEQRRNKFDNDVQEIIYRIQRRYFRGADGKWLKGVIREFHHPELHRLSEDSHQHRSLLFHWRDYLDHQELSASTRRLHRDSIAKVVRFELFQRDVRQHRQFSLTVDTLSEDQLRLFHRFLAEEHLLAERYPTFYAHIHVRRPIGQLSENSINRFFSRMRTVMGWCRKRGIATSDVFLRYQPTQELYGDPFFLTLDERNRVWEADLKGHPPVLAVCRDVFIFQCMTGCRVGDLFQLSSNNIVDNTLEYIPQKTRRRKPRVVRVPLTPKALAIIARYARLAPRLLPRMSYSNYSRQIKELLRVVGIDRMVTDLDPKTRRPRQRPLWQAASSHTARKTFVANLYKQVKDPEIVAAMSGHAEGSRAFARYRSIDDEVKREAIKLID